MPNVSMLMDYHSMLWQLYKKNTVSWWKFIANSSSDHKLISEIAIRLILVQSTNTAIGRTFSCQKFVHRKEGNGLRAEKVKKLMLVYNNINTIKGDTNFDVLDFVFRSANEIRDFNHSEDVIEDGVIVLG